jgi:hypothetical protein
MPAVKRHRRRSERPATDAPDTRSTRRADRPAGPIDALFSVLFELGAIVLEMVAIPLRAWMRVAEVVGAAVLTGAQAAWPPLRAAWRAILAALRFAERVVTPGRTTAAVAIVAAVALGASQYSDYRAVRVGAPQYQPVESVAPAPEVAKRDPRSAHGSWLIFIAAAAVVVIVFSYRGRWRLARLLAILGLAALAVAIFGDHDAGLRAGRVGIAYQGAKPVLLDGYWAEIVSAAVLAISGRLLAHYLGRAAGGRTPARARDRAGGLARLRRNRRSRPARAAG